MTKAPTTRDTADHAELARRLRVPWSERGWVAAQKIGDLLAEAKAAANSIENLLSEIAALRGERDRWHSAYEIAHDQATANGSAARQAERQRDEAVGLLREFHTRILMERRCNSLGTNVAEPIMEKTRAFLANQGADQ